jgi:RNA polymerase primary sigma factor
MSPVDAIMSMGLAEQTRRALAALTPSEEKELRKRFGIGEATDRLLEDAGEDFAVTRERIRQVEQKKSGKRRRKE